jgi:hypothetical protein
MIFFENEILFLFTLKCLIINNSTDMNSGGAWVIFQDSQVKILAQSQCVFSILKLIRGRVCL